MNLKTNLSDQEYASLPKPDESESGQMVLEKVIYHNIIKFWSWWSGPQSRALIWPQRTDWNTEAVLPPLPSPYNQPPLNTDPNTQAGAKVSTTSLKSPSMPLSKTSFPSVQKNPFHTIIHIEALLPVEEDLLKFSLLALIYRTHVGCFC